MDPNALLELAERADQTVDRRISEGTHAHIEQTGLSRLVEKLKYAQSGFYWLGVAAALRAIAESTNPEEIWDHVCKDDLRSDDPLPPELPV